MNKEMKSFVVCVPSVLTEAGLGSDWEPPTPLLFPSRCWSLSGCLWTDWKQHCKTKSVKKVLLNIQYVCTSPMWLSHLFALSSERRRASSAVSLRARSSARLCSTSSSLSRSWAASAPSEIIESLVLSWGAPGATSVYTDPWWWRHRLFVAYSRTQGQRKVHTCLRNIWCWCCFLTWAWPWTCPSSQWQRFWVSLRVCETALSWAATAPFSSATCCSWEGECKHRWWWCTGHFIRSQIDRQKGLLTRITRLHIQTVWLFIPSRWVAGSTGLVVGSHTCSAAGLCGAAPSPPPTDSPPRLFHSDLPRRPFPVQEE